MGEQPFRQFTVEQFLGAVAARESAPGGGAVAAVTVAAAAGLVAMSARFSADADGWADLAAAADEERTTALDLADADAAAYGAVLAAFREPSEESRRPERIRAALQRAAEVPLHIAQAGARVARAAATFAPGVNPNLAGDLRAGVVLAEAAARVAAELVRINVELGELDETVVAAATQAVEQARAAVRQLPP